MPDDEVKVRELSTVLTRGFAGAVIGGTLGAGLSAIADLPILAGWFIGLSVGMAVFGLVGLFLWMHQPYLEPDDVPDSDAENDSP
jgi:hypothetical protein